MTLAKISGKILFMIEREHFARDLTFRKDKSFFLWGPRQSGKTQLLRTRYPDVRFIDLLKSDEFAYYKQNPERLRQEVEKQKTELVVIDEVQKVPELLNEVHWLIENRGTRFVLCGSSARKLKRGAANLLGGRALKYELFGFVSHELGESFDLLRMLNHGYLPAIYLDDQPNDLLRSYVSDYLKEEIYEEGLVRNLPPFSDFLRAAAVTDTEIVNYTNIASDCGVSKDTVVNYYSILVDTHLGRFLPAYKRQEKRKIVKSPKFYLFDVGVVNHLAKRGSVNAGSELFGKAFENWIYHELAAYSHYSNRQVDYSYWRLANGSEVDFIVEDCQCAIEAKGVPSVQTKHLKGLREFRKEHPKVKKQCIVSLDSKSRILPDGIEVLSVIDFIQELWSGKLF